MSTPTPAPVERPNPLKKAAQQVGVAWAAASGVVGAAVAFGLLTAAQADAVNALGESLSPTTTALGTIAGAVIPLIGSIVSAFGTASAGRNDVTPVADPRDNAGNKLTPDVVASSEATVNPEAGPGYRQP